MENANNLHDQLGETDSEAKEIGNQTADPQTTSEPEEDAKPKEPIKLTDKDATNGDRAAIYLTARYEAMVEQLRKGLDLDEEGVKVCRGILATMAEQHSKAVVAAVDFVDYTEQYIFNAQGKPVPRPVVFRMRDLECQIRQNASCLPMVTMAKPTSFNDDTLEEKPLPYERIMQRTGNSFNKVYIKFQTLDGFGWGVYQLLENDRVEHGKTYTEITNFPCIHLGKNTIPQSAIWKWKEVPRSEVIAKQAAGKGFVTK